MSALGVIKRIIELWNDEDNPAAVSLVANVGLLHSGRVDEDVQLPYAHVSCGIDATEVKTGESHLAQHALIIRIFGVQDLQYHYENTTLVNRLLLDRGCTIGSADAHTTILHLIPGPASFDHEDEELLAGRDVFRSTLTFTVLTNNYYQLA